MKHYLGISAGFHDAAASVVREDGTILFAGHSERYSKIKNDSSLHLSLLKECCNWEYDTVAFYERPWIHNIQQWVSRQKRYGPWTTRGALQEHLGPWYRNMALREVCYPHHLSHAAAGFQTSPFNEAAVVVIDAIGELDTISIYKAHYDDNGQAQYHKLWGQRYPHSIGLFYSAITDAVGLKPMEEEYITMGMAAYGGTSQLEKMCRNFLVNIKKVQFRHNNHAGIDPVYFNGMSMPDIAACAQSITETLITNVIQKAQALTGLTNLVYMGGVALNCVANGKLGKYFNNIWIMPCPGDAGSSLGAAALAFGGRVNWTNAFLGHDMPGPYPVNATVDVLSRDRIAGVANGRAEFGPRALGNRSLLADPRGNDIKYKVNEIKRRQKFRPFAPVILEEHVNDYFEMPFGYFNSRYMQITAVCKSPALYPAIVHVDDTSRVQTVPQDGSGIRQLLEAWYAKTGCPMLLNTSLNIRGEPMVNDRKDANRFEDLYKVKVLS